MMIVQMKLISQVIKEDSCAVSWRFETILTTIVCCYCRISIRAFAAAATTVRGAGIAQAVSRIFCKLVIRATVAARGGS